MLATSSTDIDLERFISQWDEPLEVSGGPFSAAAENRDPDADFLTHLLEQRLSKRKFAAAAADDDDDDDDDDDFSKMPKLPPVPSHEPGASAPTTKITTAHLLTLGARGIQALLKTHRVQYEVGKQGTAAHKESASSRSRAERLLKHLGQPFDAAMWDKHFDAAVRDKRGRPRMEKAEREAREAREAERKAEREAEREARQARKEKEEREKAERKEKAEREKAERKEKEEREKAEREAEREARQARKEKEEREKAERKAEREARQARKEKEEREKAERKEKEKREKAERKEKEEREKAERKEKEEREKAERKEKEERDGLTSEQLVEQRKQQRHMQKLRDGVRGHAGGKGIACFAEANRQMSARVAWLRAAASEP